MRKVVKYHYESTIQINRVKDIVEDLEAQGHIWGNMCEKGSRDPKASASSVRWR